MRTKDGKRILVAAAIPEGAVVMIQGMSETTYQFEIFHIQNSSPKAGRIIWSNPDGVEIEVGGNDKIEVVSLP